MYIMKELFRRTRRTHTRWYPPKSPRHSAARAITLCCYERGGDSHTRIAEKAARVMRFSGSLVHYGGGLALLQSPKCAIGHEKGGITVLRMTMAFTHYPNQCYSLRKEEFLC